MEAERVQGRTCCGFQRQVCSCQPGHNLTFASLLTHKAAVGAELSRAYEPQPLGDARAAARLAALKLHRLLPHLPQQAVLQRGAVSKLQ